MEVFSTLSLGLAGAALGAALRPQAGQLWRRLWKRERPISPDQRARWALLAELDGQGSLQDRVVLWGDSLIQQFEWNEAFGDGPPIANRGVSGDRSENLAARVATRGSARARRHVVLIGVNDWWHSEGHRDLTRTAETIDELAQELAADGTPVHVLEPLPVQQAGPNAELATLRRELAKRAVEAPWQLVETRATFGDAEGRLPAKYTRDGIHLSPAGYALLATVIECLDPGLVTRH